MIVEMRTYRLKPGTRERYPEAFRMRGFADLASRDALKSRFYEDELWKNGLEALLMPLIERYDVVVVEDRDGTIRW